jgi:hypothetical protein
MFQYFRCDIAQCTTHGGQTSGWTLFGKTKISNLPIEIIVGGLFFKNYFQWVEGPTQNIFKLTEQ